MLNAYFSRPLLARKLVDDLTGRSLFSDAGNGLFLAAPRRTGKSAFLNNDLKPALEGEGILVVYVDLWSDKERDPADLIAEKIGDCLDQNLGLISKAAKASGLKSASLGGLSIDTSKIGKVDGTTLHHALKALHELANKPVALMIDEAQHALTSEHGENAMAALKSARDQMNKPGSTSLLLIMTGSDRDKLMRLVNTNAAAFYGSSIYPMPELDHHYVEFLSSLIEDFVPAVGKVDRETLAKAFDAVGHRPQFMRNILKPVLDPANDPAPGFEKTVLVMARVRQESDGRQLESDYLALSPLEQAIIWRLLEKRHGFKPYDADALRFYKEKTGHGATAQQVQNALRKLRDQEDSLIWKSARGEYAVQDAAMTQWYEIRKSRNEWPPGNDDDFSDADDSPPVEDMNS